MGTGGVSSTRELRRGGSGPVSVGALCGGACLVDRTIASSRGPDDGSRTECGSSPGGRSGRTRRLVRVATPGRAGLVRRAWTHWGTSQHFAALRLPTHDGGTRLEGPVLGRAV